MKSKKRLETIRLSKPQGWRAQIMKAGKIILLKIKLKESQLLEANFSNLK